MLVFFFNQNTGDVAERRKSLEVSPFSFIIILNSIYFSGNICWDLLVVIYEQHFTGFFVFFSYYCVKCAANKLTSMQL